jgi:D-alanyl-D-alanine dipeptidase
MLVRFCLWLIALSLLSWPSQAADAPLVYLRDVDPTIRQDIRYATRDNFTGTKVPGYLAGECLVLTPVAEALKRAQADLLKLGLSLKVYDCYRPQKAVDAFVAWAKSAEPSAEAKRFFPRTPKSELLAKGFIAPQSNHSRGAAVDVTLVIAEGPPAKAFDPLMSYGGCIGPQVARAPDDSLDMGTGFDCFDELAATDARGISPPQKKWRALLHGAMTKVGFKNFPGEWWHFGFPPAEKAPVLNVDVAPYAAKKK